MNTSIFKLKKIGKGTLYIMPCPRPSVLAEDMAFYMDLGINTIVCLLEKAEMIARGLALESYLCEELDLNFEHFPIIDRSIPSDLAAFHKLLEKLYTELNLGRNIAIHCYAGIGRTGVVAGSLLMKDGLLAQEAIELMTTIRGYDMPQTSSQYHFLLKQSNQPAGNKAHVSRATVRPWWQRLISV